MTCTTCASPTETRALFTSTYQHCPRCDGGAKKVDRGTPEAVTDVPIVGALYWVKNLQLGMGMTLAP